MKARRPKLPAKLTFQSVQTYKSAMRRYDQRRIAYGEATAAQVQRENAVVKSARRVEILNFPEAELVEP